MTWRRLLILNMLLVAVLVAGVLRVRRSWLEFSATHRVDAVKAEPEPARAVPAAVSITAATQDWTDISLKNPFSFDRNDVAVVAPKQMTPRQAKPVLFGTMAVGNEWVAMMGPGLSGGRASRPIRVGQSLEDWQVVEIRDKSVTVAAADGTRETVIMNDPTAQVARTYERTTAAAAPPAAGAMPPASAPPAPAPSTAAPAPATAQPAAAAQPSDEYLDTPFGRVKRTKP